MAWEVDEHQWFVEFEVDVQSGFSLSYFFEVSDIFGLKLFIFGHIVLRVFQKIIFF